MPHAVPEGKCHEGRRKRRAVTGRRVKSVKELAFELSLESWAWCAFLGTGEFQINPLEDGEALKINIHDIWGAC